MDQATELTADLLSTVNATQELCDTWQGRALRFAEKRAIGIVLLSVLANAYETEHIFVLLHAVFPGFKSIKPPFICSTARVNKYGAIVADVVPRSGDRVIKNEVIFPSEAAMQASFRKLADMMKLDDRDRRELFKAANMWVVADMRLDPNFDRRDPDAKRLVLN